MKKQSVFCLFLLISTFFFAPLAAQKRPPIIGVSHIALLSASVEASRAFYTGYLGFEEPFSVKDDQGALILTWFKINDRQSIELFPEKEAGTDRLYQIAFDTDDSQAMRDYLASRGVKVPEKLAPGRIGNLNFSVKDPDGHTVEFVQRMPQGKTRLDEGKHLSARRLSARMPHVGILVGRLEEARKFYTDILGFREVWRGSRDEKVLNWVHLRVPEGEDTIELMLYDQLPGPRERGTVHHLCLETTDIMKTEQLLRERPLPPGIKPCSAVRTGINRRRQINCYDPDGTRSEFMEPVTVDGKPAPSSQAPPPR